MKLLSVIIGTRTVWLRMSHVEIQRCHVWLELLDLVLNIRDVLNQEVLLACTHHLRESLEKLLAFDHLKLELIGIRSFCSSCHNLMRVI